MAGQLWSDQACKWKTTYMEVREVGQPGTARLKLGGSQWWGPEEWGCMRGGTGRQCQLLGCGEGGTEERNIAWRLVSKGRGGCHRDVFQRAGGWQGLWATGRRLAQGTRRLEKKHKAGDLRGSDFFKATAINTGWH